MFGFVDSSRVSGLDAAINWSHRFNQFLSLRTRYQYTGLSTNVTPNFASVVNVAGAAGILGDNQDPVRVLLQIFLYQNPSSGRDILLKALAGHLHGGSNGHVGFL